MQMHTGAVDMAGLEDFADNNRNVADFQVIPFLNVDNTELILGGNRLTDSVQDNGFCTQSSRFDFLLDMENQPVNPQPGEVYVPVCYLRDGTVNVGDPAVLCGRTFRVAGFIRDSQMNSTLASSKRFLINEADYARLAPFGNVEYLIEFRLHDLSKLSAFETAYSAAGLPANGPALTWPLFQMISAISDGIMIAILVLIGLLVVSVSLLCVRFTLLAKIEDDFREIGVMKAIGMRIWDIRGNLSGNLCSHGGHWKRLWIYAFPSVQRRLAGTNPPEFRRQRESGPGAAVGRPWRWDCMFDDSALCKRMPPAVSLYICRAGNPVWRTGRFQSQLPDCQTV